MKRTIGTLVLIVSLVLLGGVGTVSAHEGEDTSVVVCGSHTGDEANAGASVNEAEPDAEVITPNRTETQQGVESLVTNLVENQEIGNSRLHAGVNHGGEEQAGAGSDDSPNDDGDVQCSSEQEGGPEEKEN